MAYQRLVDGSLYQACIDTCPVTLDITFSLLVCIPRTTVLLWKYTLTLLANNISSL